MYLLQGTSISRFEKTIYIYFFSTMICVRAETMTNDPNETAKFHFCSVCLLLKKESSFFSCISIFEWEFYILVLFTTVSRKLQLVSVDSVQY